jgi:hypothetical protein
MSDWLSQISGVGSALAGLDLSMPGDVHTIPLLGSSYWMYDYSRSVLNGSIPVDRLNDAVTRILATWFQMGQVSALFLYLRHSQSCLQAIVLNVINVFRTHLPTPSPTLIPIRKMPKDPFTQVLFSRREGLSTSSSMCKQTMRRSPRLLLEMRSLC